MENKILEMEKKDCFVLTWCFYFNRCAFKNRTSSSFQKLQVWYVGIFLVLIHVKCRHSIMYQFLCVLEENCCKIRVLVAVPAYVYNSVQFW